MVTQYVLTHQCYVQGPLPGWVFYLYTCLEKYKHLIAEDMLLNYALSSFLYLLHHLWEFLEWMTTGTIGKMCLLEVS